MTETPFETLQRVRREARDAGAAAPDADALAIIQCAVNENLPAGVTPLRKLENNAMTLATSAIGIDHPVSRACRRTDAHLGVTSDGEWDIYREGDWHTTVRVIAVRKGRTARRIPLSIRSFEIGTRLPGVEVKNFIIKPEGEFGPFPEWSEAFADQISAVLIPHPEVPE